MNNEINHQLLAQRAKHVQGMRRVVAQAQELHDARQQAPPTHYDILTRIVAIASEHAEAMTAAAIIIESQFFNGQEWTGGELSTMQTYEAALEFGTRAMGNGWTFDVEQGAWLDGDGKPWGGAAVRRKIVEIAGEVSEAQP